MISILLAAIGLFLAGCNGLPGGVACTLIYAYGISGTVTDATSGATITNATLTLTDGSYQEVMQSFPNGGYVGAGERAGTYSLTAVAPGYQTKTIDNIVVTSDVCHVQGQHVDVQMQPAP